MDGDSCVDTTATPLLMESVRVETDAFSLVNLTVPLSDDTRSDFLGAYVLNATDDTASRYVIHILENITVRGALFFTKYTSGRCFVLH